MYQYEQLVDPCKLQPLHGVKSWTEHFFSRLPSSLPACNDTPTYDQDGTGNKVKGLLMTRMHKC